MITKEQAIEILDSETSLIAVEKLKYYAGFNQDKVVELIQEAMNMGVEALKGKDTNVPSKWISCSERLPEINEKFVVEAIGKATPKNVMKKDITGHYGCPTCGRIVETVHDYCWHCGQKIDWESED